MAFNKLKYWLFGRRGKGFIRQDTDERDYLYKNKYKVSGYFPATVDLMEQYKITIKDQRWTNACTGFATSYLLEIMAQKHLGNEFYKFSPLYAWHWGKFYHGWTETNKGVWLRNSLKAVYEFGFVPEDAFPFKPDYFRPVPTGVLQTGLMSLQYILQAKTEYQLLQSRQVKDCLRAGNPVVCGVMVNSSFSGNCSGVIDGTKTPLTDSHAITLVGYENILGVDYYKFANSWGTGWGEDGFGYIPVDYFNDNCHDLWTIKQK